MEIHCHIAELCSIDGEMREVAEKYWKSSTRPGWYSGIKSLDT